MNRVLCSRLAAHLALLTISFHTGDFEKGVELIYLLLVFAFLWNRGTAGQPVFFFGGLSDLGGRT